MIFTLPVFFSYIFDLRFWISRNSPVLSKRLRKIEACDIQHDGFSLLKELFVSKRNAVTHTHIFWRTPKYLFSVIVKVLMIRGSSYFFAISCVISFLWRLVFKTVFFHCISKLRSLFKCIWRSTYGLVYLWGSFQNWLFSLYK